MKPIIALGEVVLVPDKPDEELTSLQLAERSVDRAFSELQCAMVKLEGARVRLQMIRDHEAWKKVEYGDPKKK